MSDAGYLIKREQQELEAALKTTDERVRQLHLDLADAYTRRVKKAQDLEKASTSQNELRGSVRKTF